MKIKIPWLRKMLYSVLITALLINTSFVSQLKPTKAKATSYEIYATDSGGSNASENKNNILGAPNGNVCTIPSIDSKYVWGKNFTNELTGYISKVEIAATYKVDSVFTDDLFILKYKIGSTSNPDGPTNYFEIPSNNEFITKYLDITQDRNWTFEDINSLYVYAVNKVENDTDGNNLLIDSLFIKVTVDDTAPTSTITKPENNKHYNSFSKIEGEAEDNESGIGVEEVIITIKNNTTTKYFDGTDWQDTEDESTVLETTYDEGTNTWFYNFPDTNLTNGNQYIVSSKAKDKAQNWQEEYTTSTFTYDTTTPTGTIKINEGKQVTGSKDVTLNLTSTENYKMMISNNSDFSGANWENFESSKAHTLSDGDGEKTVYIKYKDQAGNISEKYEANIYYNSKAEDIGKEDIETGTKSYDIYDDGSVILDIKANENTTLTYAKYEGNPGKNHTFSPFGGYFDLSFENSSAIEFPIMIKIYYTEQDLIDAKISESQIKGLYYYDIENEVWRMYEKTGVNTSQKYVWAEVDHLTPLVMGADITPPEKVQNLVAQVDDTKVKLTWDKISDAKYYEIRYRKSTFNSADPFIATITTTDTQTEIINLTNDVDYEFNVRAVDDAGNLGDWAVTYAIPKQKIVTSDKSTVYYASYSETSATKVAETKEDKDNIKPIDQGDVESADDAKGESQSAKTAVTLGIIIIAIGAALGGYYGYQWWLNEGSQEEKPLPKKQDVHKPNKPEKKKSKSNRRW